MSQVTRRTVAIGLPALLAAGLAGCSFVGGTSGTTTRAASPARASTPVPTPTPTPTPTFDTSAHSIDDPSSEWVVVNKRRPLNPKTYEPDVVTVPVEHTNPPLLRPVVSAAVVALFHAAKVEHGLELASNSTYRPYSDQKSVYDTDVSNLGKKEADRLTLRPGYSEHQTGLAIDIGTLSGTCDLDACLGKRPEGTWLAGNAWRFGFLLRYPSDREHETGIEYEPWHFRYVGKPLARELHETRVQTLEEFFGLPASPDYL